ncbi:MAG: bifunctional NAD(P)H-hydrate repair enzyme Nnr [Gemmatimonadota bacterium]|nr:MAG: bifunctional NAD(P)H-hydrate repair enzyme Nnr [Gemmatimonadota bacterium]
MRVVTASEMREIDRKAIEECGIPSLDLMERAGAGAAHVIASIGMQPDDNVVFLCGKGNNGGDGFVAARYLREWGAHVTCWVIAERDELSSDALRNLVIAEDAGVAIRPYRPETSEGELQAELAEAPVAVDALLGTGSRGRLREPIRAIARTLNNSPARVFALDMPTGMNADSGEVDPDCVKTAMTITFGFPKRGLYALPGRDICGDVTVVDLGYPEESIDVSTNVLLWQDMRDLLVWRDPRGHKGTFGRAVVIAGSRGMSGAACLAAESALRSGAGVVQLLVPEGIADLCATKLTEVMVHGVPSANGDTFTPESIPHLTRFLEDADSVLLGPGISEAPAAHDFIRTLLPRMSKPLVLDADGLNALRDADSQTIGHLAGRSTILTPHPGELGRLLDRSAASIVEDAVASARDAARVFRCEVILKGAPSIVASPGGAADLCSFGNDGMATAGTGDVLAGLLTGLLAQEYDASRAARVGVMVHSRAGDICRSEIGRHGMLAGDLLRCVPYAWRELEGDADERLRRSLGEEPQARDEEEDAA